jgi:LmbE family N-acetylglucosaminyl deacetylase
MRRSRELAEAAATLRVTDLIELGHRDSGFGSSGDSPDNSRTNEVRFTDLSFDAVLLQIEALMWWYHPDVVVTYPSNGLSGHPDHIRVHDLTVAAHSQVVSNANYLEWTEAKSLASTASALPTLYYIAVSKSELASVRDRARSALGPGAWLPPEDLAVPDSAVTTKIDVTPYWEDKLKALGSHSSQADARMLLEVFRAGVGTPLRIEEYIRAYPPWIPSPSTLPQRSFSRVEAFSV